MSLRLYIVNKLVAFLPPTRCYLVKARLYRWAGVQADRTARIVSSASLVGSFRLRIGAGSYIGHDVMITGGLSEIKIGDCVDIGPRTLIVSGTHEIDMIGVHSAGLGLSKDILIEDGVWIGAHATIMPGVTIGKKAVVGAGSVVNRDIPPYVIAVGNPCRAIKRWDIESQNWVRLA
jgi:acetyltransferase-like isoleucine patch superfamily enzyme